MAGIPSKFGSWLSGATQVAGKYLSGARQGVQNIRDKSSRANDIIAGRQAASVQPSYSSLTSTQSTQKPSTGIPYSNIVSQKSAPAPMQSGLKKIPYSDIASSNAKPTGSIPKYDSLVYGPQNISGKQTQTSNGVPMQSAGSSTAPVFGQVGDGFTSGMDMNAWVADQYAKLNEKNAGASSASGNELNGNMTMQSTQGYQPSALDQQIAALQKQLAGTYSMGSDESALQSQLTDLQGNTALGVSGLEGQGRGIPRGLVRGQQEKLQTQGNLKAQTLEQQLANLMSQRQMKQQGLQTQLGFAQKQYDTEQAKLNPMQVGNSIIQYDPATGQYVTKYSAPDKAAEQPSIVQEFEYAKNSGYTGSFLDYQKAKSQGSGAGDAFNLSPGQNRYDGNGNLVASGGAATPTQGAYEAYGYATRMDNSSKIIDDLDQNFTGVTGQGFSFTPEFLKGDNRKSIEQAERDFVNALLRRESGAAVSPAEFESAKKQYFPQAGDSAARLEQKKKNRDTSLNAIRLQAKTVYDQQGQGSGQDDPLGLGFSNAPSTALNGSASQLAAAIKKTESNGNYNARGGSGESGAYQFMPSTWRSWAGQYLGNPNAPMTPQNQDHVAQAKIQDLLNQGYNAQQVALIWNGGQPVVKKGVNKYGVAYDSGAYANKVLGNLA